MIEFDCEGCGIHVYLFAADYPRHGFCGTCAWLCEHVPDPVEFWQIYKTMQKEDKVD